MSGWISRQQFEETWMSLLGVLNPLPSDAAQTPPTHEVHIVMVYCIMQQNSCIHT